MPTTLLTFPKKASIETYLKEHLTKAPNHGKDLDKCPLLSDEKLIDAFAKAFSEGQISPNDVTIKSAEVIEKFNPNLKTNTHLFVNSVFTKVLIECASKK